MTDHPTSAPPRRRHMVRPRDSLDDIAHAAPRTPPTTPNPTKEDT
jgi:hypothetical protein